jgi:hypothetical protein
MFESSHVIFPPFFVALFRISNVTDFWRFVNGATAGQQKIPASDPGRITSGDVV